MTMFELIVYVCVVLLAFAVGVDLGKLISRSEAKRMMKRFFEGDTDEWGSKARANGIDICRKTRR